MYIADRYLYLDASKRRIVEADDPEASYLLAAPGGYVSDEDVKTYGLDKASKASKAAENKAASPAENKAAKPAETKSDGVKLRETATVDKKEASRG